MTDMATAWKNSCFILSEGSDFHIVVDLPKAVYALLVHMLISLSVDEILLPRYMHYSTISEVN